MIYITGDTHIPIDINKLSTSKFPEQKRMTKDDYVIICGDFGGVWNGSKQDKYWLDWLDNNGIADLDSVEFNKKIKNIEQFTKDLIKQKSFLEGKLSNIEKQIIDIEHAAEFFVLSADKGYKIYKMLHEARIERRKCKDGLAKISIILDGKFEDYLNDGISKTFDKMNHREYKPRALKELFSA